MEKKKINILITCIGYKLKKDVIGMLKKSKKFDYNVVGTDIKKNPLNKNFLDFFYSVPKGHSRNYIETIKRIVFKHKVDILLPSSDEEAFVLSNDKVSFKKIGCLVGVVNKKKIRIIMDKIKLFNFLKKKKVPLAKWKIAKNLIELKKEINLLKNKKKQIVVKSAISRGGRGVYIINNKLNITRNPSKGARETHLNSETFLKKDINFFKKQFPVMIMERLKDPVYDVDVLTNKGLIRKMVIRKRKVSTNPNMGHKIISNKKIENYCKKIAKSMHLSYLIDFDIMFDKFGNPKLLEINPRMSGSLSVSMKKGFNLIDNLVSDII